MHSDDGVPEVKVGAKHDPAYYAELARLHYMQHGQVLVRARGRHIDVALSIVRDISQEKDGAEEADKADDVSSVDVLLQREKRR